MKKFKEVYWPYFLRIVAHKWYVFLECNRAGISWRGIMHDRSKFYPDEFWASARYHMIDEGLVSPREWRQIRAEGGRAWGLHKRRNPHHPEWWIEDECGAFPMSRKSRLEMVCDWKAAERSYPDSLTAAEYYLRDREKILLDDNTRFWVECYLELPSTEWTV